MKSVVSEKGQVTIPKPLRDRLGLRPGQVLEFDVERGRLVARKASPQEHPVDRVAGVLTLERTVDEILDEMRGPRPTR